MVNFMLNEFYLNLFKKEKNPLKNRVLFPLLQLLALRLLISILKRNTYVGRAYYPHPRPPA